MSWWQLTVQCSREQLEQTENTLLELGALSLTIGDAQDEPIYEPLPGDTPVWSLSTVTGLFEQTLTLEQLYDDLVKKLPEEQVASIRKHQLEDQVWERVFLERYHPIQCGEKLWICPSWIEPPDSEACNVILDPGIAFGTGSHPTTALCLEFIGQHPPVNQSVLDFGCGSGILAIAAHKLGANKVSCIDIDPQALDSTRNNALRNQIDPELWQIALPGSIEIQPVEYLMANILSGPLIELEPQFSALTLPGARLILSGILSEQADDIISAYSPHFELDTVKISEDWCRVTGIRKSKD